MRRVRRGLLFTALLLPSAARAVPPSPPSSSSPPPTASSAPVEDTTVRFQLDNGLRVVIARDPRVAEVSVEMMYGVGSGDDPDGYRGLAHLTEHMLFQASRHVEEDGFVHLLERAGASSLNGATGFDNTFYFETVPATQLPLALWLESERMAFAIERITPTAVEGQRRVVINEERWRRTDDGGSEILPTLYDAIFPATHPYHHPIEALGDLGAMHATDIQWFLQRYYTPDNAVLAIVGDVDPASARGLVERYFGAIPGSDHPVEHMRPAPRVTPHTTFVEFDMPYLEREVIVAWHAPPLFDHDDAALDLVAELLSNPNGQFQRTFRAHHPTLQHMHADQEGHRRGPLFTITFRASWLDSAADLFPDLLTTLDALQHPPADVVVAIRNGFRRLEAASDESPAARAARLCDITWGDDPTLTEEATQHRYDGLTAQDVGDAVARWLSPEHATVLYTVPTARAPREGTRAGATLHTLHTGR